MIYLIHLGEKENISIIFILSTREKKYKREGVRLSFGRKKIEMEDLLQKNDIIRTPRGYFAKVNWDDGENVGVSYIEKVFPSLACMTFKKEEIFVVKRGTEMFFKEVFKKMEEEEKREEIKQERAKRKITPTKKEKVIRKRNNIKEILKELNREDERELVKMIRERKEKREKRNEV